MPWPLVLRPILAALVFLPSLLAVVPPGLNLFWKLSIPVKEAGFLLTLPCLALAFWAWGETGKQAVTGRLSTALFCFAAALYAYPLARALETGRRLQNAYAETFEKDLPAVNTPFRRAAPVVWKDLVPGVFKTTKTPFETYVYSRPNGAMAPELRLDFYPARNAGARPAPCIVVIHGGGWDTGERGQLAELNSWLADGGYAVADIDYRLAPKHIYPAPIEDVADALAFLKYHARRLGIDSTRLVLLGRSAGGQIALQAAYTLHDPAVRAVIAYYAPADMVFGYSLPGNPLILDSRKVMDQYLGGGCLDAPARCRDASPLEFADANSPPTLLLHGAPDALVSRYHTVHLKEKLRLLGVPHFAVELPWATHGYDFIFWGPGSQISLYFIERFLARTVP